MPTFKDEIMALFNGADAATKVKAAKMLDDYTKQVVENAVREALKSFPELKAAAAAAESADKETALLQLKIRGFEMAHVERHDILQQRLQAMRDRLPVGIAAARQGKYTPEELLVILEGQCEALQAAGSSPAESIRAQDLLNCHRRVLASGNPQYIAGQTESLLATTGLLYG